MLDDRKRKEVCLARMKASFHVGFMGNAKEVLDGSAEEILRTTYGGAGVGTSPTSKRKRIEMEKGQRPFAVEKGLIMTRYI
jgi:hypothetical protein